MMTHAHLVQAAARWLYKRCPVVITEMASQSQEPDAIGWKAGFSTLIECKASRSDFLADKRKNHVESMGDFRYYMVPSGLIWITDVPSKWGLLYVDAERVQVVRESEPMRKKNARAELALLISCIRRIGSGIPKPTGVSVSCYVLPSKNRATVGIEEL